MKDDEGWWRMMKDDEGWWRMMKVWLISSCFGVLVYDRRTDERTNGRTNEQTFVIVESLSRLKKLIFSKKPKSVICLNIGGSQGSGPSHPDGIGPLGLTRWTTFLLLPPVLVLLILIQIKNLDRMDLQAELDKPFGVQFTILFLSCLHHINIQNK